LLDAGDIGLGGFQTLTGLRHHSGGGLRGEGSVIQLPRRLLGLGSGRREILFHPAALGGDIDDPGHVELDGDAFHLKGRGRGETVRGRVKPQQRPDLLLVRGQQRALDAH
jgi:hypothetical protein